MSDSNLKEAIRLQREKLTAMLSDEMHKLAVRCIKSSLLTTHPTNPKTTDST